MELSQLLIESLGSNLNFDPYNYLPNGLFNEGYGSIIAKVDNTQ